MPPRKRAKLSWKREEPQKRKSRRNPSSNTKSPSLEERKEELEQKTISPSINHGEQEIAKKSRHGSSEPTTRRRNDLEAEDEFADEVLDEEMLSPTPSAALTAEKSASKTRFAGGYDALKTFNGQVYSGMSVGASNLWEYQPGKWKETKVEPDLWKIDFETDKKRSRNAPKGSGAPVGTEYHWFIVAHQYARKIDANTYSTHLTGSKYKLAYKNAASSSWSINSVKKQREREVFLLEDAIKRVEGLPPVLGTEKVKVPQTKEKGQMNIATMFSAKGKRKADEAEGSL